MEPTPLPDPGLADAPLADVPSSLVRPTRRRALRLGAVAAGVAALVGAGYGGWRWWARRGEPADAPLLFTVQRGDIEDLVAATGTLQPRNYVDVGAQVSGQLRRLLVEVGAEVREGDLLAEIDAEQSAAKVDSYRAQVRNQQAQLAEQDVAVLKAERDLKRQRQLLADEATTLETVQNAETTWAAARAGRESILAQIAQIQATMRVEEANLKYTRLVAPISGTVVSITARQGQTLNANQSAPTVLRVADLSLMTVQAQVSEADVGRLRLGMPVYFTTLGSQGRRWPGQLQKIEPTPTVTNNVVLYNALFEVPNPQRQLMTQMTAQVFFVVAQVSDVLMVPMAALTLQRGPRRSDGPASGASAPAVGPAGEAEGGRRRRDAAGPGAAASGPGPGTGQGGGQGRRPPRRGTVKVLLADGRQEEREVTVGVSNRVHAQVLSGLKEGEQVVAGVKKPEPKGGNRSGANGNAGGNAPGALGGAGGLPGGLPPGPGGR